MIVLEMTQRLLVVGGITEQIAYFFLARHIKLVKSKYFEVFTDEAQEYESFACREA